MWQFLSGLNTRRVVARVQWWTEELEDIFNHPAVRRRENQRGFGGEERPDHPDVLKEKPASLCHVG